MQLRSNVQVESVLKGAVNKIKANERDLLVCTLRKASRKMIVSLAMIYGDNRWRGQFHHVTQGNMYRHVSADGQSI